MPQRKPPLTAGLLVSQPHELQVDAFEQKIEFLEQDGMYLVAERAGVLIGHALLEPLALTAQAHVFSLTIIVHPGHLEHGIGTALMVELMGWAENNPRVEKIELRVRATNARALALYKRFGFVEEGRFARRVRLRDGSYIDDVLMARFTP